MASTAPRRTILGRLAGNGWFTKQGEVAATTALAVLLEEESLRLAVLDYLTARTGRDLSAVSEFQAEARQQDLGRPDLEGTDQNGLPLVKIEAKFAHALSPEQLGSFLQDQRQRLGSNESGVLVLLVPSHRAREAETVFGSLPPDVSDNTDGATHVLSWDTLLDVLDSAVTGATQPNDVAADLVQFRDLCETLQGLDIAPLGDTATGTNWEQRQPDLQRVVELVTEDLSEGRRLLPTGKDSLYTFRRYINTGPDASSAVGIVGAFAKYGHPLWLRYHKEATDFANIDARLNGSNLRADARREEGHIWLPLDVPADLSGAGIVVSLVEQVRRRNIELVGE